MTTINLEEFGIYYNGPIEEIIYIQRDAIPRSKYVNERVQEPYTHIEEITLQRIDETSTRRFYIGPILSKGTYGYVEYIEVYETTVDASGNRQQKHETIVRKRSKRQHHSLFLEACLQHIAYTSLEKEGFHNAVAKVTDIYRLPGGSISFTMEALRNVEKVSDVLNRETDSKKLDKLVVSILAQVAIFVQCLESNLCLNHRDMKGNNILITKNISDEKYINTAQWRIFAEKRINIVDFGFACIGLPPPPVMPAILSSDDFFNEDDGCPKKGRDLFQLLSFFYIIDNVRNTCSPRLVNIIESCIHMKTNDIDYCSYLRSQNPEKIDNIYDIIAGAKFEAPSCDPKYLLTILSEYYPDLVASLSC